MCEIFERVGVMAESWWTKWKQKCRDSVNYRDKGDGEMKRFVLICVLTFRLYRVNHCTREMETRVSFTHAHTHTL